MEIDIFIDSITNCLLDTQTGRECDTEYRMVQKTISQTEAEKLQKDGWKFDWSVPHKRGYEVYELLLKDDEEVQGMIVLSISEISIIHMWTLLKQLRLMSDMQEDTKE